MHPGDASSRGIGPAQLVRVTSRVGSIEVEVELCDDMMPGVVSLPHGWGHTRPGTLQATARQHAGVSVNDITDEQVVDTLSGNAAFSRTPVEVVGVG
jgi:anaerobic selenocysteine-containing dehydrogenase